ncbi:hypothetical protein GCM10022276_03750 [Sphingomonas limnosediminicola]|uniref:Lipoprotein n=1 Tax=Sphingomonas limnosediminicola TaxID=940133 RepID=A0ABP7KTX9_9SPHN
MPRWKLYVAGAYVALGSCVSNNRPGVYRASISVEDLIRQQGKYDGKRVEVTGYLVSVDGHVQVLSQSVKDCYAPEGERAHVTTTMDRSALGQRAVGQSFAANEGRLATVSGVLNVSTAPWGTDIIVQHPPFPAVGPLKEARVVSIGAISCTLRPL